MVKNKYFMFSIGMLLSVTFILGGCQPLRRKFTRKKTSEKKDKFIPILDPVDYEGNAITRQQKYHHHYLVYRVWERELIQRIQTKDTDKRTKQALEQVVLNLERMDKWISINKKNSLTESIENYRSLLSVLEKPKAFRNMISFEGKLRKYERIVRKELKPELIFGDQLEKAQ